MKKVFLFLIVAGFAFASCGKRTSEGQGSACAKGDRCCSETLVVEEEVIVFDDEVVEFVD